MTSLARDERAGLLELLATSGPSAPTLCGSWTTHDLAAHLVVRERQPLSVPGYVLPALGAPSAWLEARARRQPYETLLTTLADGPPAWSPLGSPVDALYDLTNLHEFFVHSEDVRRPGGLGQRTLPPALEHALWARLRLLAPVFLRRVKGTRVSLETPAAQVLPTGRGPSSVVVRGRPGELFLWAWGRPAEVVLEGDVSRLDGVRIGP